MYIYIYICIYIYIYIHTHIVNPEKTNNILRTSMHARTQSPRVSKTFQSESLKTDCRSPGPRNATIIAIIIIIIDIILMINLRRPRGRGRRLRAPPDALHGAHGGHSENAFLGHVGFAWGWKNLVLQIRSIFQALLLSLISTLKYKSTIFVQNPESQFVDWPRRAQAVHAVWPSPTAAGPGSGLAVGSGRFRLQRCPVKQRSTSE